MRFAKLSIFALVIAFSIIGLISLALASVVLIRSFKIKLLIKFHKKVFLKSAGLPNFRCFLKCFIPVYQLAARKITASNVDSLLIISLLVSKVMFM